MSRTSLWLAQPPPGWPITEMLRTISKPGASQGTRICEARAWGSPSGSVTAITIANDAPSAEVVNHLWPSIT